MPPSDATISIRLPAGTRKALDAAAKVTQRSRAFLIKEALDRHLAAIGAEHQRGDAERRLRLVRSLKGMAGRTGRLRSASDIDASVRRMRGDD
jgi:predicted DNA-binding protein